jgi:hypothetical protein
MFGLFKKKRTPPEPPKRFPPVPDWAPAFSQPIEQIVERIAFYANNARDFAVFRNGTVAILRDGLSDDAARTAALDALRKVFHAHVDMNPKEMKDGNIVVHYHHDVANVVLAQVVRAHWKEIDANHRRALATDEVLITPHGPNVFDDFGKKILFGRCYLFMDAQDPEVVQIRRKAV